MLAAVAGGALLVSIGFAIVRGQPWLLTHPAQRQRLALEGTPLSLEVPRSFGRGAPGTSGEGTHSRVFDDLLESPGELFVTTEPTKQPLSTEAERQQVALGLWKTAEEGAAGRAREVTTRRLSIDDFPTLVLYGTLPRGTRVQEVIQVRSDYILVLQLRVPADTPQRMVPDLQTLIETVQEVRN